MLESTGMVEKELLSNLLREEGLEPHTIQKFDLGRRATDPKMEMCIFAKGSMINLQGEKAIMRYPSLQDAIDCILHKQVLTKIQKLLNFGDIECWPYVNDQPLLRFRLSDLERSV